MKKLYLWKRTLAGLLAFVVVSGAMPVDLGGLSKTGKFISAQADVSNIDVSVAERTDTGVKVEWNSLGDNYLYKVYVSETPDFENFTTEMLQASTTSYNETGLKPGTNYYFKVEAFPANDFDNVIAVGKTWAQTSKTVNLFYNTPDKDSVTLRVDEELTKELFKVKYDHEPNDDELEKVEYQWYDEDGSDLGSNTEKTVNFDEEKKNSSVSFYYVPIYHGDIAESLYDLGLGYTTVKYNYGIVDANNPETLNNIVEPEKNKEETEHNILSGGLALKGYDQNYAMRYGVSDSKYDFGTNEFYDSASALNTNKKLNDIGFKYIWVKAVDTTAGTNTIMEPVCIGFTAVYPEDELLIKPEFKTDVKVSTDGVNILKEGTGTVNDEYKEHWVWVYSFDDQKTWSETPVLKKDGEIKVWYALAYKTAGDYEVMVPTIEFADIDAEPIYSDADFDISTNTIIESNDSAANAEITINNNGEIESVAISKPGEPEKVTLVKDTDYTVKKNNDGTYTIRAVLDSGYSGSITGKIIENKFFRQWNKANALPMSGSWYLDKDVTVNDHDDQAYVRVRNNAEYDLDLNGKAVVINVNNINAVQVEEGGTFKLYDYGINRENNVHYYTKPIENSPATIITDENNIDNTTPFFNGGYISVPKGSAVHSNGGKFYMMNSTIFGCGDTAVYLRGVGDDDVATISDSAIIGNISTTSNAGGGFILENSNAIINDSLIADNVAAEYGGGMYIAGATSGARIEKSIITNNVSKEEGGGIYIDNTSGVQIENSTINANVAGNHGGAIFADRSTVKLDNVTVEKNIRYVSDNNTPKTVDDNVFLSGGSKLTLASMPNGKELGVGTSAAGEFVANDITFTNTSGDYNYIRDYFTSESDEFYIMADNSNKAVFAAKPVIEFNANGGTGTMESINIDPFVDKAPECKIAPPNGKEFDKWIDANANANKFAVGDALTTYIGKAQATLKAQWKDKLVLVDQTEKLYLPTGYGTGNKLEVEIDTTNAESYNYTYQWYEVDTSANGQGSDSNPIQLHNQNNNQQNNNNLGDEGSQQNNETGKTVTDEILRKSRLVPNANEATFEIPVGNGAGKYEYFCKITAKAKNNNNTNDRGEAFYSKIIPVTVADVTANIKFEGNKAIEVTNVRYDNVPLRSDEYEVNITESGSAGQIKITLKGENQSGSTIFPYIHTSAVASTHYAEGNIEYWTYNGVNYAKDKNNKFQIVNDTSVSKVAGGTRVEKVEKNGYTYIKVYCELCGKLLSYKRIKIKS